MIPFFDLKRQYSTIKEEVDSAINSVLESGNFVLGDNLSAFEKEFASYCNTKYAVGVGSGTDALTLSLNAIGIVKGDEVITTANTFVSTALAISHLGARPILVDINRETYTIDVNELKNKITNKTKAIIPVHLYGHSADIDAIVDIVRDIPVIEDAAQSHGGEYKGKKTGSLGKIGCFSLYPVKNLGAYGEAGIITTNDSEIAEKIENLRNIGGKEKYNWKYKGYNSRLDEIQAAILRIKLKYLDKWNDSRREHAKLYTKLLKNVTVPSEKEFAKHVYHLYVIRNKDRDRLKEYLQKNGIQTFIHYPTPIHKSEAYSELNDQQFPITEESAKEILSLPMFPELKEDEIRKVAEITNNFE